MGRIFGIPLEVSYSWFIILALATFALAYRFGETYPYWSGAETWLAGAAASLLFFSSVLVHELSHSLLAIKRGIPVTGITLFIFGGISHIAREANRPLTEFTIAAIGPLSSLILGGLFVALYFAIRGLSEHLGAISLTLGLINFSLGIFNMLPGFPLDGGRVMRSIIWVVSGNYWRATILSARFGQVTAFSLVGLGLALIFFSDLQGIWIAAVGWFLIMASSASLKQFKLRQGLQGHTVRDLMGSRYGLVAAGTTLETLASTVMSLPGQSFYVVMSGNQCLGLVPSTAISKTPRYDRATTSVESVMQPLAEIPSVEVTSTATTALEILEEVPSAWLVVLEGDRVLGFIERDHVVHFQRTRYSGQIGTISGNSGPERQELP